MYQCQRGQRHEANGTIHSGRFSCIPHPLPGAQRFIPSIGKTSLAASFCSSLISPCPAFHKGDPSSSLCSMEGALQEILNMTSGYPDGSGHWEGSCSDPTTTLQTRLEAPPQEVPKRVQCGLRHIRFPNLLLSLEASSGFLTYFFLTKNLNYSFIWH